MVWSATNFQCVHVLQRTGVAASAGGIVVQNVQQPAAPGTAATGFGDGKLKVFISYSRRDAAFASELLTGLEIAGFEPFLDTHDIAPGEPWEDRLGRLIESADTVVYVISPNSVGSAHCLWEVEKTEALAKRLLPIVWQQVEEGKVPDRSESTRLNSSHPRLSRMPSSA